MWGLVEGEGSFALGEGYNVGECGTNLEKRRTAGEEVIHFPRDCEKGRICRPSGA